MENTSTFTQAELVETIWTARDKAIFAKNKVTKTSMLEMDVDALISLAEQYGISLEPVSDTQIDLPANGLTPRTTLNGTIIYTMDLKLIFTDGFSFHFEHGDAKVIIAGDIQLSDCFTAGSTAVGDMIPFHYHGADTWKALSSTGKVLVPNNSGERAENHSNSGTIAKSFYQPIEEMLAMEKLDKAKKNLEMMRIAKSTNLKVRVIRNLDLEDRTATAKAMLAELRNK
jgi:hypothetical protein